LLFDSENRTAANLALHARQKVQMCMHTMPVLLFSRQFDCGQHLLINLNTALSSLATELCCFPVGPLIICAMPATVCAGSMNSSLRSATDAGNARADGQSDSATWRLKPALWWTAAPVAPAPAPAPAAAASSVRSKGGSRGSSKRSDSSSSGSSSDGGKQAAGRRKRMSLFLLLSLIVVLTAAGMGVGVYFGLIRQTPVDTVKEQVAAAAAAGSVGGFDGFGVPDAAVFSGPVPPMNFQVVLAVPAVSADQGCRTWFSSSEVSVTVSSSIDSSGSSMSAHLHSLAERHHIQVVHALWCLWHRFDSTQAGCCRCWCVLLT
jgi:hypothetical protein